jgi:hypothetical protein
MIVHEIIKDGEREIKVYGSGRDIKLFPFKPSWSNEEEQAFKYRDIVYCISEFVSVHNSVWFPTPPEWMKNYDLVHLDTIRSLLVKLNDDGETVKVYCF